MLARIADRLTRDSKPADVREVEVKLREAWSNRETSAVSVEHEGVTVGVEIVSDYASMAVGWAESADGERAHETSHTPSTSNAIKFAVESYEELTHESEVMSASGDA